MSVFVFVFVFLFLQMHSLRVDFPGFVTMMARKVNNPDKSEAELLAAFTLFAQKLKDKDKDSPQSDGRPQAEAAAGEEQQAQVPSVLPVSELRHVLQNTGDRLSANEVDALLSAVSLTGGAIVQTATGPAVDYAKMARRLLR